MATCIVRITHWLPIVTLCPVNRLPDFIYVTAEFSDIAELYAVRRRIKKLIRELGRINFMETFALHILNQLGKDEPTLVAVEVRLAFNRHFVRVTR